MLLYGDDRARAGVVNGITTAQPLAASFQSFTPSSSTALTIPTGATCAYITATGANVNWRDDGTPTATVGSGGQQLANGASLWSCGNLSTLKFIQQTATATVSVSYYK